jgi:hypothetical protein
MCVNKRMFKLTFFFFFYHRSSEFLLFDLVEQLNNEQRKIKKEQERIQLNKELIEEYVLKLNNLNQDIKVL